MERITTTFIASVISEIQQSDIYLTVKARLFETPGANLNGVRVTPAFLDEIIQNQEKYVGLPVCADVKALANGNYEHLGHLYDARTGEFHSAQIGSFYQYEKEETAEGAALIGYARIMKRNKAVCKAIAELFADNALKFSFEISCGSYRELDDGTLEIDAGENNFLEGAAIVTFPACENAVALDLVAECNSIADDCRRGENKMTDELQASVKEEPVIAEAAETEAAEENVVAEETTKEEAVAEAETAETKTETQETEEEAKTDVVSETSEVAEVIVREETYTEHSVHTYDTETGVETHDTVTQHSEIASPLETTSIAETDPEEEKDDEPDEPEEQEEPDDEMAACGNPKEEKEDKYASVIAEMQSMIQQLKAELDEIKNKPEQIIAEAASQSANDVNPFLADIDTNAGHKYSLLEKAEKPSSYSLLDRA